MMVYQNCYLIVNTSSLIQLVDNDRYFDDKLTGDEKYKSKSSFFPFRNKSKKHVIVSRAVNKQFSSSGD